MISSPAVLPQTQPPPGPTDLYRSDLYKLPGLGTCLQRGPGAAPLAL